MQQIHSLARASLLTLSTLAGCAASDPMSGGGGPHPAQSTSAGAVQSAPSGVYADFLVGRFATTQSDPNVAADAFLKALAVHPDDSEVLQQAFIAALMSGRSDAVALAHQLAGNQMAELLLVDQDARAANWRAAERRLNAMPRQGLTQLLQPMLLAWVQAGGGRSDVAIDTLRPYIEGQRFRGIFALHAAIIADVAKRPADATRFYAIAEADMPEVNLRLAEILASWQSRSGHPAAAQRTLASLGMTAPDMTMCLPALAASAGTLPVARYTDGMAEAYLALGAALQGQDSGQLTMMMVRLALDLRPDFTAARLLAAEVLADQHRPEAALQMLAGVQNNDPLAALARLRHAVLTAGMGHSEDALRELDRLAAEYPDNSVPAIEQGDLFRSKHRNTEAIAAYTRAIAHLRPPSPTDWVVFYERGIAYEESHQWRQAEADFRHALQLAPDQPSVLNYLGYSWADMGRNLPEARQMIQKAAERRPNDGAIIDSLGWVMLRQGDVVESVSTLEHAVELQPEDPTINGHLGDAYAAAGRKLEAQYQWRRALTLNPEPADAAKLEAKLQTLPAAAVVTGQQVSPRGRD